MLPTLIINSAAEISTGVICVCLPTLAALRRRTSKGPSSSILHGISKSTRVESHEWERSAGLSHQDPISGDYIEMEEGSCQDSRRLSANGVFTEIEGGADDCRVLACDLKTQDLASACAGEKSNLSGAGQGILKTMTIEQSSALASK